MYLEPIGIGELEREVVNLGFCTGDVFMKTRKSGERTGEMMCYGFDSILHMHFKDRLNHQWLLSSRATD